MKLLLILSLVASAYCTRFATVDLVGGVDPIHGRLYLTPTQSNGVLITGQILGLTPGLHGFHVHERADLSERCSAAGGHFNPSGNSHGSPYDQNRHAGDLGNIQANLHGVADIYIHDVIISLHPQSPTYIGNRAIVVHQGVDDLGRGGNADSLTTGNAGSRSGCGLIVY